MITYSQPVSDFNQQNESDRSHDVRWIDCIGWVLRIAKVGYFFSPSLPNVEWPILGPLPFLFYQKSFIFHFLENCFWGPKLHNAVG